MSRQDPAAHQRLAGDVRAMLEGHPLLRPLREARCPVQVECDAHALWARATPVEARPGRHEARIELSHWWRVVGGRSEIHARHLANWLAMRLRSDWDASSD